MLSMLLEVLLVMLVEELQWMPIKALLYCGKEAVEKGKRQLVFVKGLLNTPFVPKLAGTSKDDDDQ
jgi:hypothetical protein